MIFFILILFEIIIKFNLSKSITNGGHSVVEFTIENQEFDYLFLGDSRVWHGIDDFKNYSNLNMGSPGVGHNIINRKLEKILLLNKVKTVVVDYQILFKPNSYDWFKKEHYLKHMFLQKESFSKFSNLNGYDFFDFYIPIFRYRNFFKQFVKDIIGYSNGSTNKYGFRINETKCSNEYSFESRYGYDFSKYNDEIMKTLEKYNIQDIYFIDLPYLNFRPSGLISFQNRSIFKSPFDFDYCDFEDARHLNLNGKIKFSNSLLYSLELNKNIKD